MRTEPPAGDDFERMIVRITENVLLTAGSQLPAAAPAPKPRFRFGALSIVVLVVLGLGAAGGALAIGLGNSPWGAVAPTATTSTTTAIPTRTPQPTPTVTTPAVPAVPTVAIGDASFSPPSWGDGISVELSGFAPNTDFALSIDSRYPGESSVPGGYFSEFSTPLAVTTDDLGGVSVTWIPDSFPQNVTGSGESGYVLGSYVRVDTASGPQRDPSGLTDLDPIALSSSLSISYLPTDGVSVEAQSCIEPEQLVGDQAGLSVTLTGLLPGELIYLSSFQTGGPVSYSFQSAGSSTADETGSAVIRMTGNSAMYPVSTSAMIAPGQWRVYWAGGYRVVGSSPEDPALFIPLTVGGCG